MVGPILYAGTATRHETKSTLVALRDYLLHHKAVCHLKADSYRLRSKPRPSPGHRDGRTVEEGGQGVWAGPSADLLDVLTALRFGMAHIDAENFH